MTVIVCGVRHESPTQLLIKALKEEGISHLVLNQEDLAYQVQLRWQYDGKGLRGKIRAGNEIVDIDEISGVFLRFMDTEFMPSAKRDGSLLTKTRSIIAALHDLIDILPAKVINPRRAMLSNFSKPYQSRLIRKAGFNIPETIITNDPDKAGRFILDKSYAVIYKSISSERSIVKEIKQNDLDRLHEINILPTQFQRKIDGYDVRVHVVDDKVFATKIISQTTDYRYSHLYNDKPTIEEFTLPEPIERRCVDLTHNLGLVFSGIDLMITEDEAYCLEVNTSPGYSFFESNTGQRISKALAEYLK